MSSPSSWRLANWSEAPVPSVTSVVPAKNAWPPDGRRPVGCDELLDDRCLGLLAETDEAPGHERAVGRADRPAHDDGPLEPDAVGDVDEDALRPQRSGELGELVGRGDGRAAIEQVTDDIHVVEQGADHDAGSLGRVRQGDGDDPAFVELDQAVGVVRERAHTTFRAVVGRELDRLEARRAQVDVGRVQQVGLAGERGPRFVGGAPIRGQPIGRRGEDRFEGALIDRQRELIEGPTRRPRS